MVVLDEWQVVDEINNEWQWLVLLLVCGGFVFWMSGDVWVWWIVYCYDGVFLWVGCCLQFDVCQVDGGVG